MCIEGFNELRSGDRIWPKVQGSRSIGTSETPSDQPSPQQIQRRLRCAPANQLAIAGKFQALVFGVSIVGKRDVNQTDRLFFGAAARSSNAGDRQAEISLGAMAN